MTTQEQLQFIREKCIEANPSIKLKGCTCKLMADETGCLVGTHYREIRLADVLLAMNHNMIDLGLSTSFKNTDMLHMFPQGNSKKEEYISVANISVDTRQGHWNLVKDDVSNQTPETTAFLVELLHE